MPIRALANVGPEVPESAAEKKTLELGGIDTVGGRSGEEGVEIQQ